MTAKEYARQAFDQIIKPKIEPGGVVPLAEYATLHDYEKCIPFEEPDTCSWYERRRRTTELAELIEIEGGCQPVFVQIDPAEYFQCLETAQPSIRRCTGWRSIRSFAKTAPQKKPKKLNKNS
jgi:hypothetical protein